MHPIALQALKKLLTLAERSRVRQSSRKPTLVMTRHSFVAYLELNSREQADLIHAAWREAERAGAIAIEWDVEAGENGQVVRLRLHDEQALVSFLQVKPLWERLDEARIQLRPWLGLPRVQAVLSCWESGKSVRGNSVHKCGDLTDALRVIDYCQLTQGEDLAIRVVSTMLFRSSKRLERLVGWLDVLTSSQLSERPKAPEEVLAALGLVRYPYPALLAGSAAVEISGNQVIEIPKPYIGISPGSVVAVRYSASVSYVLTVENLTTFNEFAALKAGPLTGVVLFCPGMPSPSWLRLYEKFLGGAPPATPILHYGDIDTGGFRIAGRLAACALTKGRHLKLWGMNPAENLISEDSKDLSLAEVAEISRICGEYHWLEERTGVQKYKKALEQEALPLHLPLIK